MRYKTIISTVFAIILSQGTNAQTDSTEYMRGYADGIAAARLEGIMTVPAPEPLKTITNARMIGVGSTNILDTYISPEKYTGTELRYISHTIRERKGKRISREIIHQGYFSLSNNRADTGDAMAGMYIFGYGAHYNWQLLGSNLNIRAGGMAEVNAGFLYNTRNGNNPAQARLSLNISPSAAATYKLKAWNHIMAISYEVSAPLAGVMFSPNYGQAYYEIFSRGDYDHNVVPTTFINTPSLKQMLTLDFYIRRTAIRLGYLCDIQQAKVNNLKYHNYSNMLLIGLVRHFNIIKSAP